MRVGIISVIHESNTFIHTPTTIDLFRRDALLTGQAVTDLFQGGHHESAGSWRGLMKPGSRPFRCFTPRHLLWVASRRIPAKR